MAFPYPLIDNLLEDYKASMGEDYARYRNHVYRVFFNCLLMDNEKQHEERYAIAAVFHDIGIWTNHTIDYLDPSIKQADMYLSGNGKQAWIEEISLMIYWHHKLTAYKGENGRLVETFRKADWIDVSLGIITFGFDRKKIRETRKVLPNLGFHLFLIKSILSNWLRHPLKPLPMFKN